MSLIIGTSITPSLIAKSVNMINSNALGVFGVRSMAVADPVPQRLFGWHVLKSPVHRLVITRQIPDRLDPGVTTDVFDSADKLWRFEIATDLRTHPLAI
jgi:hypothetical protein